MKIEILTNGENQVIQSFIADKIETNGSRKSFIYNGKEVSFCDTNFCWHRVVNEWGQYDKDNSKS